ncbi:MAG: purine-nucleoside phosphorylase [Jiangellales bacterium]
MTTDDPTLVLAQQAAARLAEATGIEGHDVAVVLGSGWGKAADLIGEPQAELSLADLPGFSAPSVAGHGGTARTVRRGNNRCLVFLGRTHLYEGKGVDAVAHTVRTAAAAGCTRVVLTNGCGGLDPAWAPGTVVLISDHLNLTAISPLRGAEFVDLTDLYSPRLRAAARQVDPALPEGVYAQLPGPHYETPAEIRMLRTLGADLVGMSTTLEAIAARAAGLEVLGLSLVTNAAAGMSGQPLDHAEVLESGRAAANRLGRLLGDIVERV